MFKITCVFLLLMLTFSWCIFKNTHATESTKRYDGSQLLRLYNITLSEELLIKKLIEDYEVDRWQVNVRHIDILVKPNSVKLVHEHLKENNIKAEVLHSNVQKLITQESLMLRSKPPQSKWKSGMHWEGYHDIKVIYGFLDDINRKYPNITRLITIGRTHEGRALKVLRISENLKKYEKIWIDAGIHAREWISIASVTYILDKLLSDWKNQPKHLRQRTWYFMPVVNPDGYVYSRKSDRFWRKNRAPTPSTECVGVDLNRNFPTGWEPSNKYCLEVFPGTVAGSELETRAIIKFLKGHKSNLKAYITFHSYSQFIMFPFASKEAKTKNDAELRRIGVKAAELIKRETGSSYEAAKSTELIIYGDLGGNTLDWSYSALNVRLPYAVELRDMGKTGFLLPPAQIKGTGTEAFIIVNTIASAIEI